MSRNILLLVLMSIALTVVGCSKPAPLTPMPKSVTITEKQVIQDFDGEMVYVLEAVDADNMLYLLTATDPVFSLINNGQKVLFTAKQYVPGETYIVSVNDQDVIIWLIIAGQRK